MFEARSEIFKFIVKKERVNLDMASLYIFEDIAVGTGTYRNFVKTRKSATSAGSCRSRELDCPNYRSLGIDRGFMHSARDRDCPIFVRYENRARRGVA